VYITPLYKNHIETVSLYQLDAYTQFNLTVLDGAELLVIEGEVTE